MAWCALRHEHSWSPDMHPAALPWQTLIIGGAVSWQTAAGFLDLARWSRSPHVPDLFTWYNYRFCELLLTSEVLCQLQTGIVLST